MALTAIPTARREVDALAGIGSRVVSAAAIVLTVWLFSEVVGSTKAFWWPLAAWGVGLVVSFAVPQTRTLFASMSGVVAALLVVVVLAAGFMVLAALTTTPLDLPPHLFLLALVPIGLDWHLVVRLRARVLASGFAVVLLVGLDGSGAWATGEGGASLLVAIVWFAVALAALWLLHRDQIGALPRPSPLGGQAPEAPPVAPGDFLLIALVSALVAVVIALLVAGPDCMPWEACAREDTPFDDLGMPGDLPNPGIDGYGEGGSQDQWGNWGSGSSGGGDPGTANGSGYYYDGEGRAYAYHPGTDSYLRVPAGDAYAYDPESGYHYDGDGDAYTYDDRGDAYRRAPEGDALVPDPEGEHFYKDGDGDVWVPSENGKPIPPGADITEGRLLDGVVIDGVIVEGDPYQELPPGAELDPGEHPHASSSPGEDEGIDWTRFLMVLGALLLVGGLVALAIWWWRRQPEPEAAPDLPTGSPDRPWAEAMVRRLVAIGGRRDRPRLSGESVESFAADLASGAVGDRRLAKVGVVLSGALFGAAEVPAEHRAWVEGVLDQIDAADAVDSVPVSG